jgi:hypothetical protein
MGICICTYNCIVHNPEGGMLCDECFKGTNGRLQLQQNGTQSRKEKSTGLILQKTAAFSWWNPIPLGLNIFTLWLFNIAMENGPFIDGLYIKHGDFPWLC